MNVLSIILLALFCAIGGYFIGLNRGNDTHKYDYDEGYTKGYYDCYLEMREGYPVISREDKARELIRQLDELFEDDEEDNVEILDGGEY